MKRDSANILNVVVTCSSRKSVKPAPDFSIRSLPGNTLLQRFDNWRRRIEEAEPAKRLLAKDLYQGDHWATMRRLIENPSLQKAKVQVWIASAGCGLISPQTHLPAYAATFSSRDLDCVGTTSQTRRAWWSSLSSLSFKETIPRSLTALAECYPTSPLLVAASPDYLDAMGADMIGARDRLRTADSMTVLCREGSLPGELDEAKVYLSADLATSLGGALTSLNARVIVWLLSRPQQIFRHDAILHAISELRSASLPRQHVVRQKGSDSSIRDYIRRRLQDNAALSGSAALADYRQSGMAAEQSRFRTLYLEVKQEVCVG